MDNIGVIYALKNRKNNKYYIGQTTQSVKVRLKNHLISNSAIGNALRKYGKENFGIKEYKDIRIDWLDWFEIEMIAHYNSICPNGYNIMLGGQVCRISGEIDPEVIKKRADKLRGRKRNPELIKEQSERMMGHKTKKESIEKMSKTHKELWNKMTNEEKEKRNIGSIVKKIRETEEGREKIKQAHKGHVAWNKGKHLTKEHVQKLIDSHKGKPNNQLGLKRNNETKKKMSLAKKGKHYEGLVHYKK
ncbi:GIY-YIG nuclease family protein [Candidatus Dojkabacteria bacterium]|jgi:group I intron endonuclease|nr:GIY-YIG nuclease family protein [Candidatus Dojkabacteria bacterium]